MDAQRLHWLLMKCKRKQTTNEMANWRNSLKTNEKKKKKISNNIANQGAEQY